MDSSASVEDTRLRVCLERQAELGPVHLRLLDWPGHLGPLVHVPDPFAPPDDAHALAAQLADALSPRYRLLSVAPRADCPYLVQVDDVRRVLEQFGFVSPVLVTRGRGVAVVQPLAAWYPRLVGALVLVDPCYAPPGPDTVGPAAQSLHDCPPDWPRLANGVTCPSLVLEAGNPSLLDRLRALLEPG